MVPKEVNEHTCASSLTSTQHSAGEGKAGYLFRDPKAFSIPHALNQAHSLTQATNPTWLQFEKTPHPIWWFRLSDWRALRRSGVLSQNRPAVGKRGASAVTWNKSTWWLHLQWAGVDFKLRGPTGPPQGPGHTTHPFQGCFLSSEIKGLSFVIPTCRDHSNRR